MKRLFSRRKSSQPTIPVDTPSTQLPPPPPVSLQPKSIAPPLPYPCPHASIHVLVTTDGLVLRPHIQDVAKATTHVRVPWGKDAVVEEIEGETIDGTASTTVYGIVGILRLFHASYIMVITSCAEVGDFFNGSRTVYKVNGVSAIPLEHARALATINMLASHTTSHPNVPPNAKHPPPPTDNSELFSTSNVYDDHNNEHEHEDNATSLPHVTFSPGERGHRLSSALSTSSLDVPTPSSSNSSGHSTPTSSFQTSPVARALAARLSFWSRLPKPVLTSPVSSHMKELSVDTIDSLERRIEHGEAPSEVLESIIASTAPPPSTIEEKYSELDEKIVRETTKEFVKGGMFFSYSFDITTSLQRKQQQIAKLRQRSSLLSDLQALDEQPRLSLSSEEAEEFSDPQPLLPLWRRVDRKFWWNESLLKPFVDAGLHSYVLPIMQGYFQIASFRIPPTSSTSNVSNSGDGQDDDGDGDEISGHKVDYILVSRRSRERAGLRYQRRGIDDDANVANFVETETIMRIKREGRSNMFSHVQIRGSIPLFWTQSGYGLKPPPQLSTERTQPQRMDALKRHFSRTLTIYGPLTVVNLAEQHGKEGAITSAFRESMSELGSSDVQYHEYDFHAETKGMRYENISKLIANLERTFESQGFFWVSGGIVMSQQKGAFRMNCIDCLDRTNVVQSAFARFVLQGQLEAVALPTAYEAGDRTDADVVFNDVWANNGDAISRAYAGTSALKGDFTRTGKRDLGGLFNDGLNSLSRVYTSTFSDWFSQAVIDFFLGYRTLSVFSEFLLKLSSTDPRELIRISKIRAAAIETCSSRVLFEGEKQIGGWTLFSPVDLNTRLSDKFEEKVLLLTTKALYMVSYDYNLEKVKLFTRIPLGDITKITKGLYILSPLEEASRIPDDNYGFVISYLPSRLTTRVTSYSLRNTIGDAGPSQPPTSNLSRLLTPRKGNTGSTVLSKLLSNVALVTGAGASGAVVTAAFKVLPTDHLQNKSDVEDPIASATTCRGAVDLMVDMVQKACADVGNTLPNFVIEEDIVSLSEAQRMTSIYSKLEYNFKRLLWLGG